MKKIAAHIQTHLSTKRLAIAKQTIRRLTQSDLTQARAGCDTTSVTTEIRDGSRR